MKKNIYLYCSIIFFTISCFSQEKEDQLLKDSLYFNFKKEVINYSFKEFDQLFFEFHKVTSVDAKTILTKIEYYTYTIKIAAFNDRYAALYPKEKDIAEKNKQEWYNKKYSDYLLTKQKN